MSVEQIRNLIVGSGAGGKIVAWNLGKHGEKSVVIERALIGGACPNVACLPSKNVIHSAKAISLVDPNRGLGVTKGELQVDMAGVVRRKRKMVEGLVELHLAKFKAAGAELVMGNAKFIDERTVEVSLNGGGTRQFRGERIFIAVGSRASIPPPPGLMEAWPLTHIEALDLERLPEHLVVIGGGYVGLEFAQAMRRFGSRVTVIQRGKRLLEREDADIAEAVEKLMRDEGVEVLLQTQMLEVSGRSGTGVKIRANVAGSERTIEASDILVAAGRTPNTDRIGLEKTGVEVDERGFIRVNDKLETNVPNVWALADCAGSPQFTHAGEHDGIIVVGNLTGGSYSTRGRLIPYCLFTDPELAHVGMTESEAKAKNIAYRLAKQPMSNVLRSRTLSETRGFAKVLIGGDDRILGFTAFGAEASEMMAAVQTAMVGGLPYTVVRDAVFAHPTTAEGLLGLLSGVPAK